MNSEIRSSCRISDRALNGHADWKGRLGLSGARVLAGGFVGRLRRARRRKRTKDDAGAMRRRHPSLLVVAFPETPTSFIAA